MRANQAPAQSSGRNGAEGAKAMHQAGTPCLEHGAGRKFGSMTDSGADKPTQEGTTRAHILVFEDDETLAGLLARVLRTEGYQVDLLDSVDGMPAAAKLQRYDVVLSDIHLANDTN